MNEHQWLCETNPFELVCLFLADPKKEVSERKRRLLACAICRSIWSVLSPQEKDAVCVGERYAEGQATDEELKIAGWHGTTCCANRTDLLYSVQGRWGAYTDKPTVCSLVRDIIGNPFRPMTLGQLTSCPQCFAHTADVREGCEHVAFHLTPELLSIAQAAYDERSERSWSVMVEGEMGPEYHTGRIDDGTLDPVRLAILADALEEANCPLEEQREIDVTVSVSSLPPQGWAVKVAAPELLPASPRTVHLARRRRDAYAWSDRELQTKWLLKYHLNSRGRGKFLLSVPNSLLAHLRSPGPHVRGCWVLDLLLGKE